MIFAEYGPVKECYLIDTKPKAIIEFYNTSSAVIIILEINIKDS